jgi:DNA-binding NarL/FixJ family response regulator
MVAGALAEVAVMDEHRSIRVLTVDDHPLFREGIATVIKSQPDMLVVAEAASGAQALRQYREHRPDVTLMDARLPDMNGIETMIAICSEFPQARVIILSTFEGDMEIQRALQAGARGFILKSGPPREFVEVVRQVHAGKKSIPPAIAVRIAEHLCDEALTTREVEVLTQVARGNRNREIGKRLFISEDTVKRHMSQIMRKLGVGDRTEALTIAARRGIIQL